MAKQKPRYTFLDSSRGKRKENEGTRTARRERVTQHFYWPLSLDLPLGSVGGEGEGSREYAGKKKSRFGLVRWHPDKFRASQELVKARPSIRTTPRHLSPSGVNVIRLGSISMARGRGCLSTCFGQSCTFFRRASFNPADVVKSCKLLSTNERTDGIYKIWLAAIFTPFHIPHGGK